ncbi:SpoIIE family protein phosphatase [Streptomyces sp. NBC_01190]|uniref:SpoIIE family protein phosphatase n=1 Tax=Streptomyces sp. NBC_01190 TaxID=2903767 RepID=UPI0038704F3A|nr:SpoIIE family protein phosphatase [Streptomyces sp. NBC_01190]
MSASESTNSRDEKPSAADSYGGQVVRTLLNAAIREVVDELDAVMAAVYFADEGSEYLCAAMIGGTSPATHAMPERIAVDDPYASGLAYRTGQPVVMDGSDICREEDDLVAFLSSFSVVAAPITCDGHTFGVLTTVSRPLGEGTQAYESRLSSLRDRARGLALALNPLAERGIPLGPPPWPIVIPLHRRQPNPYAPEVPGWGLPEAPGSAGHTFMYQIFKLDRSLNRALSRDDITATAQRHLMEPFKAQEMMLAWLDQGRLWVVGHRGRLSPDGRELHGAGAESRTPAAEVVSQGKPLFYSDRAEKSADFPETPEDGTEACAYLPLKGSRSPVGVCYLATGVPHTFAAEERAVLMVMAGMIGAALERVCLAQSEHELAQSLQKRLLPRTLSELPELVVAARYLPAGATTASGGDWFDVVRLGEDRIALIVGDVEGHGVDSATVMGQVRTSVLAYIREGHPPAVTLERAGRLLADMDTELFATCCVVFLDGTTGVVTYCLAGHPRPVSRGSEGLQEPLDGPPGPPLGVQPDIPYQDFECSLDPGTLMLLYTNGIARGAGSDCVSYAGQVLDGLGWLPAQNLEERADKLVGALPAPQSRTDDAVLLLARYEGPRLKESRRFGRLDIQRRDLQGVANARGFVRSQLESWDRERLADTLEMIASELSTNALIHADSDVQLRLREFAHHIGLEVIDSDAAPPVPAFTVTSEEDSRESEHGRGLVIVDALASAFGSSPNGLGKTVWAEVATD